MSSSVTVTVKSAKAGKQLPLARSLPATLKFEGKTAQTVTVAAVKAALHKKYPKFPVERQKLALADDAAGKTLPDEKTVAEILFDEGKGGSLAHQPDTHDVGVSFTVKDLGPQVSWRTVFLVEYAGPLVIHPLIYHLPKVFYGQDFEKSNIQKAVYAMVLLHFLKREFETLFVHRFSHATMPLRNIFKNSAHYHLLSGVLLAGAIYGPWNAASKLAGSRREDTNWIAAWAGVWALSELLNLQSHITLRNLRPAGTRTRGIPRGGLFEFVSCPNYTTEIFAWIAVSVLSLSYSSTLFTLISAGQMSLWAIKKHKQYKKEFGVNYPKRKILVPFIW